MGGAEGRGGRAMRAYPGIHDPPAATRMPSARRRGLSTDSQPATAPSLRATSGDHSVTGGWGTPSSERRTESLRFMRCLHRSSPRSPDGEASLRATESFAARARLAMDRWRARARAGPRRGPDHALSNNGCGWQPASLRVRRPSRPASDPNPHSETAAGAEDRLRAKRGSSEYRRRR